MSDMRNLAWRSALGDVAAVLFSPRCANCEAATTGSAFCNTCLTAFEIDDGQPICRRCGVSVGPFLDTTSGCDRCREERFAFESVHRLGGYESELGAACRKIKHLNASRLATALIDLLVERKRVELEALGIDAVMAVPLHRWRRCRRGYDQAEHLGRRLAKRLHRPYWNLLSRVRNTVDQMRISATERRQNVRDAFACRSAKRLRGSKILLVDDVLTTGSTCNQAAKAVLASGAARVHIAVIARGGEG